MTGYSRRELEGTPFAHLHIVEKVIRICRLLEEINNSEFLKKSLALKGGTSLNLIYNELPRLSIDLDFNYIGQLTREKMLEERGRITELLKRIASFQEYTFMQQMNKYAQDRFILSYEKLNGGNETIEVEINYMLRVPLYKPVMNKAWMLFDKFEVPAVVNLSLEEICAGKFSALLFRATPRDLFDSVEIIKNIERLDYSLFRSAFIFYCSIQAEEFETAKKKLYKKISNHDIKTQLLQTLRRGIKFNLEKAFETADPFIDELLNLRENEQKYLKSFSKKVFEPELLFNDNTDRIKKHPQVEWLLTKERKN